MLYITNGRLTRSELKIFNGSFSGATFTNTFKNVCTVHCAWSLYVFPCLAFQLFQYFTACYTVLKRPNNVETAVHGCNLAFSLDSIVSLPR